MSLTSVAQTVEFRGKKLRDLNQGKEESLLLVQLGLSFSSVTPCSAIPKMQDEMWYRNIMHEP